MLTPRTAAIPVAEPAGSGASKALRALEPEGHQVLLARDGEVTASASDRVGSKKTLRTHVMGTTSSDDS